jgi:hypothetical protein
MKRAFRIGIDTKFQDYSPDMPEAESSPVLGRWILACRSLEPATPWFGQFSAFVRTPQLPASDFMNAPLVGRFAISEKVHGDVVMRGLLEAAGELLPMEVTDTGNFIYAFNPLVQARKEGLVDLERCERRWGDDISKIAFHDDRLPDGGLFTIPEYSVGVFAVHSPDFLPERDFVQWYRKQGYTGLKLIEAEKAYM